MRYARSIGGASAQRAHDLHVFPGRKPLSACEGVLNAAAGRTFESRGTRQIRAVIRRLHADNERMTEHRSTSSTTSQGVTGTLGLLALAAIPLWWSKDEVETGNRLVLLALAALLVAIAVWRGASTARAAMQAPSVSSHGWRAVAALLCGSMALTIALFADGFAFFMWDAAEVLWLAVAAIAGAIVGHWLLRSRPSSVLSVVAGAVGVLHLVRVVWSSL